MAGMIDVRASEATVPSDKTMILGLIESHGGISAMEALVRGVVHWALQAARKFEQLGYTHHRVIRGSGGLEKTFDARGASGGATSAFKAGHTSRCFSPRCRFQSFYQRRRAPKRGCQRV